MPTGKTFQHAQVHLVFLVSILLKVWKLNGARMSLLATEQSLVHLNLLIRFGNLQGVLLFIPCNVGAGAMF